MRHSAKWQAFLLTVDKPDAVFEEMRAAMVRKLWGMDSYTYAQQQKLLIPWQEQYMQDHAFSVKENTLDVVAKQGFRGS